jgi:hypothetical protein
MWIDDKLNDDHQHIEMLSSTTAGTLQNTKWQSCIDACMRCAEACEFYATSDLKEQDVTMMASCAQSIENLPLFVGHVISSSAERWKRQHHSPSFS